MKISKKLIILLLSTVMAVCCVFALTACGDEGSVSEGKPQLAAPTEMNISCASDGATVSFKAVENATYYRVYYYYLSEPGSDYNNEDYFEKETVISTNPGPDQGQEVEQYKQNEDGSYVLKDKEIIIASTPTYSKRFSSSEEAGATVTTDIPSSNLPLGEYYVAVKAGGPISKYRTSVAVTSDKTKLVLKLLSAELTVETSKSWRNSGTQVSAGMFGSSYTEDRTTPVFDGDGMLISLTSESAKALYSANPNQELQLYVTNAAGERVDFSYVPVKYCCNDSNTFCGWSVYTPSTETDAPTAEGYSVTAAAEEVACFPVNTYVYGHEGPNMHYDYSADVYISGLEAGLTYKVYVVAKGSEGSSYDSDVSELVFEFGATSGNMSEDESQGGEGGGGDMPMPEPMPEPIIPDEE